jgi:DNA-binding IclR family transcriptional regulator
VFDHRGQLVAALVAVGHNGIMDTSWDGPIARSVAAAADELSRRLGAPETAGASAPG